MPYRDPEEAANYVVLEGWREKTNTGENQVIDPKHLAAHALDYNRQDPSHPALLDNGIAGRAIGLGLVILIIAALCAAALVI